MGQPPVNAQPRDKRVKNFDEVALGYSKKQAVDEARRCIQCANPVCTHACPLGIDIPGFIRQIRENEPSKALSRIKEKNMLSAICGRLCPAPCEKACVFEPEGAPIGIRALERFASDQGRERTAVKTLKGKGKKVAVVGSGPSGLSAASELAQAGYQVTVFESLHAPGGVLRYGIPEFRLPNKILDAELAAIEALGVSIKTNSLLGQTVALKELTEQGFAAVFLALGTGAARRLDIPGTSLGGVCYAEEFLMRVNLFQANQYPKYQTSPNIGRRVVVLGDGYAALDCARTAVRMGREVTVVFSRTEEEMSVRPQEKEYGKEEGIKLEPLAKPLSILSDDDLFASGVKCVHMDFADPDSSGKWQLVPVADSEFAIEADTVIIAAGHRPNDLIRQLSADLKINKDGSVWTNPNGAMTSINGVFAGGPATGSGSVVEAMASGKKIAVEIDKYLKSKN